MLRNNTALVTLPNVLIRYRATENGKKLQLDTGKMKLDDIVQEVDRHSRALNRQAELAGER